MNLNMYKELYNESIDRVLTFIENRTSYSLVAKLKPEFKSVIQVCLFYYEESNEYIIEQGEKAPESEDFNKTKDKLKKDIIKVVNKNSNILNNCNTALQNLLDCIDQSETKNFNNCNRYYSKNSNLNCDIDKIIDDYLGVYIYKRHYPKFPNEPIHANIQLFCDTIEETVKIKHRLFPNLNIEMCKRALFEIVLIHEFAHAYHHIGFNMDSEYCENFYYLTDEFVEGYANFFTNEYCTFRDTMEKSSLFTTVFKECTNQKGPYSVYLRWKNNYAFECVRDANNRMRLDKRLVTDLQFENLLNAAKGLGFK
jgi:hypothetical protein